MTYLFDAKYRIDGKVNGVDSPPDDSINQMHRYRDAIYYKDNNEGDAALKKEVIGGYILFPGDGEPADVQVANFLQNHRAGQYRCIPFATERREKQDVAGAFHP